MISDDDLAVDLRRARNGDLFAAARVYDQTCVQAWLLARCLVREELVAEGVLIRAYREALDPKTELTPSLSPHAWVLLRVQICAQAIAAHCGEFAHPEPGFTSPRTAILAAIRVRCAHLLTRASEPRDQS